MNKTKISIIIFIIIFLIGLIYLFFAKRGEDNYQILQTNQNKITFNGLEVGVSSYEDTKQKLGTPTKVVLDGDNQILEYLSRNPNFNNKVTIDKTNKVEIIKEIISNTDKRTTSDIVNKFGQSKYILYGPRAASGFDLFVYPDHGIAYIGQQNTGILFEIWYFKPTTIEDFKSKYAQGYNSMYNPAQ